MPIMPGQQDDLTHPGGGIRLFVEDALGAAARIDASEPHAHYLRNVMRAKSGDAVRLFNDADGEWRARIALTGKRGVTLACEAKIREQVGVPDLWLLFALVKRAPIDFLIEKATELGVAALQPVITSRTIVSRVNLQRLRAHAIEAAEQSGRLTVPELREPRKLAEVLSVWDTGRTLIHCDESGTAPPIALALQRKNSDRAAILIGPEGGFDDAERAMLRAHASVLPVSLGPRVMRADTAALAALAVWQSISGDWR